MTASLPPVDPTNAELKVMIAELGNAMSKQNDKVVEILVRQRSQDEKLTSQGSLLTNLNQRLVAVENKAERTARLQDESEGSVMAEMSHVSSKVAAVAAETHRQSRVLAEHGDKLETLAQNDGLQNAQLTALTGAVNKLVGTVNEHEKFKRLALGVAAAAWVIFKIWLEK